MQLPADTSENELLEVIDSLNARDDVDGILAAAAVFAADQRRHRDRTHPADQGRRWLPSLQHRPPTASAAAAPVHAQQMTMLARTGIDRRQRRRIIGQSNIVGRPMFLELLMARCTVTVSQQDQGPCGRPRAADIVVAAVGVPRFVTADWIKPGDRDRCRYQPPADGSLCGDADTAAVSEVASWITPVPGGVGPMTVATLLENTPDAPPTCATAGKTRRIRSGPARVRRATASRATAAATRAAPVTPRSCAAPPPCRR